MLSRRLKRTQYKWGVDYMRYPRWLLMVLIFTSMCACTERTRTPSVAPEWGRANRIGTSSRAKPVGLVTGNDGTPVVLAWPVNLSDQDHIHLYMVNSDSSVGYDANLDPPTPGLNQVKLVYDSQDYLHLVWTAGLHNARELWIAKLPALPITRDRIELKPECLSPNMSSVVWYDGYPTESSDLMVMWLGDDGQVYTTVQGSAISQIILQNTIAINAVQVDGINLQLVWAVMTDGKKVAVYTATLDIEEMDVGKTQLITYMKLQPGMNASSVGDLVIGKVQDKYFASWMQPYVYGGRSTHQLVMIAFTLRDGEGLQVAERVVYPFTHVYPPVLSKENPMNLHMVQVADNTTSTTIIRGSCSMISYRDMGVVLAASVCNVTRTREEFQPSLIYFGENLLGHHPLTWTDYPSLYPVISSDTAGDLYVVWIDNVGVGYHYPIYLATTAQNLQDTYRHLTRNDYAVIAWDWLNRSLSGIILLPFVFQWFLAPVCFLVVFLLLGDRYGRAGAQVLLGGLFLYWSSKYVITSQLLTLLPEYSGLYHWTEPLLPFVMPICTLSISIIGSTLYRKVMHRSDDGVIGRFMSISLPDVMLSLIVYAIGSFG